MDKKRCYDVMIKLKGLEFGGNIYENPELLKKRVEVKE